MTNPMDYEAAKFKVMRRLGLPGDGLRTPEAMATPEMLDMYGALFVAPGFHTDTDAEFIFATMADAAGWCEAITETGDSRERITLSSPFTSPYGRIILRVRDWERDRTTARVQADHAQAVNTAIAGLRAELARGPGNAG